MVGCRDLVAVERASGVVMSVDVLVATVIELLTEGKGLLAIDERAFWLYFFALFVILVRAGERRIDYLPRIPTGERGSCRACAALVRQEPLPPNQ